MNNLKKKLEEILRTLLESVTSQQVKKLQTNSLFINTFYSGKTGDLSPPQAEDGLITFPSHLASAMHRKTKTKAENNPSVKQ